MSRRYVLPLQRCIDPASIGVRFELGPPETIVFFGVTQTLDPVLISIDIDTNESIELEDVLKRANADLSADEVCIYNSMTETLDVVKMADLNAFKLTTSSSTNVFGSGLMLKGRYIVPAFAWKL